MYWVKRLPASKTLPIPTFGFGGAVLLEPGFLGGKSRRESLKPGSRCDQVKFGACSFAGFKDSILARRANRNMGKE